MAVEFAICVGSGPSLAFTDYEKLCECQGGMIICVNSSFLLFDNPDIIFSADYDWWKDNYHRVSCTPCDKWTTSSLASTVYGLRKFTPLRNKKFNSGMRAIELACCLGFKKIVLIGFDCSVELGSHWHGEHVNLRNPTDRSVFEWKCGFVRLKEEIPHDVVVLNCSAYTELDCFPVVSIDEALTILLNK